MEKRASDDLAWGCGLAALGEALGVGSVALEAGVEDLAAQAGDGGDGSLGKARRWTGSSEEPKVVVDETALSDKKTWRDRNAQPPSASNRIFNADCTKNQPKQPIIRQHVGNSEVGRVPILALLSLT